MSIGIDKLVEPARSLAEAFVRELDRRTYRFRVVETLRTREVQIAYHAQGRLPLEQVNALRASADLPPIDEARNASTITNCDGIKTLSPHQSGLALDVYPVIGGRIAWVVSPGTAPAWLSLGEVGESVGLEWGGRWAPIRYGVGWDAPHFQAPRRA